MSTLFRLLASFLFGLTRPSDLVDALLQSPVESTEPMLLFCSCQVVQGQVVLSIFWF